MPGMSIKDRITIITGAGRGIGRATARLFAGEGARVILFSRTPSHLDEAAAEMRGAGGHGLSIVGDVFCVGASSILFQKAMETSGRVVVLVYCARLVSVR